ncbi:uncharacterized protein FIBRA_03941 [Fibroporia radiculosa]|uniref:Transcription factor CBF/NF-Y/archaeal histone domain-containing protein n=1 Tax=Fibroporia radiculosa TaxID=599839 RepID=J4GNT4_9APHY|nr:uncharacterized protein FIBRA_03941 [Fibroporia radiculosa]CCM01870.1 predicted protein [Fibroporia radiculosa]
MALGSTSISGLHPIFPYDVDNEDEEEVDQLDSDLDDEDEVPFNDTNPSTKTRPRKTGERIPGHTLIPTSRVENILHADGGGGHMSKEALFMLSVATEEFVKRLAEAGQRIANSSRRSVLLSPASVTRNYPEFTFLNDMIPPPMTLAQALELRATRAKELADDDPAIAPAVVQSTLLVSSASQGLSQHPKIKANRSRQTNGREKTNGSASASSSRRQRDSRGRWSQNDQTNGAGDSDGVSTNAVTRPSSARIRGRSARVSDTRQVAPSNGYQNGVSPTSWGAMLPPPSSPAAPRNTRLDGATLHSISGVHSDDSWSPPQYTDPASAYIEDHRIAVNSIRGNGMTDAPGRTIYSQQRPPQPNNR